MGLFNFFRKKNSTEKAVISDDIFQSQQYQVEILALAVTKYYELDHSYNAVGEFLESTGHSKGQSEIIIAKLKAEISKMVSEFEEAERTGKIAEIKIVPNEDHFKNIGDTKQADKYIAYGCYQMEKGHLENALELFDAGIKINPIDYKGYANKASALIQMGQAEEALTCYDKAISLKPNDVRVYQGKADLLESQHNYKGAISCYAEALKIEPNNIDLLSFTAICYGNLGNEAEAISYFDKIIKLDDDNLEARLNKGNALFLANDSNADVYYNELVERYPVQPEIVAVKPLYLERNGRREEAKLVYDDLYQRKEDIVYIKLKAYYLYERDKQAAIATCYAYLAKKTDDAPMMTCLAQLLFETGGSELDEILTRLLKIDPDNYTALYHKVRSNYINGDIEGALALSDRLYEQHPTDEQVTKQRISLFENVKTKHETFDLFEDMIKRNPKETYNINYQKALYLKTRGDYEEAINLFEKQNSIYQFAWNYYQVGIIYNILGDTERCIQYLSKTFLMDPSLKADARAFPELANLRETEEFIRITS